RYAARDGKKAADKYSARPGYSEHQTGLTFDIGGVNSDKNLYASFGKTKEGQWIAKNAHKYGFIVRYPKGKEKITGYQ
ncbi:M15 family metallopeptidase, partial [Staphylococcus epidermidis]